MLALAAVWLGAELLVARPVARPVDVTRRLGAGERSARADAEGGAREMRALGASFDAMADTLQARERELAATAEGLDRYFTLNLDLLCIADLDGRLVRLNPAARHALAAELWGSGVHEARILAALVDDASLVTRDQMDDWVSEFDSWDLCDQVCANLFDRTEEAWIIALEWCAREEEFVRRAGFALIAALAWHRKDASAERFRPFFAAIEAGAVDPRNYARKAVSWALRQIGKHDAALNAEAVALAERLRHSETRSARWVGADVYRELTSAAVRVRLGLGE